MHAVTRSGLTTGTPPRAARAAQASRQRGLSLFELMVTITLVGLLSSLSVPSLRGLLQSMRTQSEMAELVSTLQSARAEAIRVGLTVTVCGSVDGRTCHRLPDVWETGWLVFVDANGNQRVDDGETVLRTAPALGNGDTLRGNTTLTGVSFNREGFASGMPSGTRVVLHTQPVWAAATRCLSIQTSGLLRLSTGRTEPDTCT